MDKNKFYGKKKRQARTETILNNDYEKKQKEHFKYLISPPVDNIFFL